ncbi:hypothetical protein [Actinoalloteichus spitiensis]|uniref:hypothetical protein n=1 Tax=Actinoalloteichus spitiensis TaxID=252394 RepID=UPI00035E6970|nr:hypothetical protein [Actinoalloteichus spitiensis]
MSTSQALLGPLDQEARHGYDLERAHDERSGRERGTRSDRFRSIPSRWARNASVEVRRTAPGSTPERTPATTTGPGRRRVPERLSTPREPAPRPRPARGPALPVGRGPRPLIDPRRGEHRTPTRGPARGKRTGDLAERLVRDHAPPHREAVRTGRGTAEARTEQLVDRGQAWSRP